MPRYYFDVEDDRRLLDKEGTELSSLGAVETMALTALFDIARDNPASIIAKSLAISVRDEAGKPVYHVTIGIQARWNDNAS